MVTTYFLQLGDGFGIVTFRAAMAEQWRQSGGVVVTEVWEPDHETAAEVCQADLGAEHEAWILEECEKLRSAA